MIDVAIITVPRVKMYVHQTILNLEKSGFFGDYKTSVRLHVGTPVTSYLRQYKGDRRSSIESVSMGDAQAMSNKKLWQRQGMNYSRCLLGMRGDEEILILEDDLDFADGWYGWMLDSIKEIRKQYRRWILTLCCFTGEPKRRYDLGEKWFPKGGQWWGGGACGIVYPADLAQEFSSYVYEHLVVRDEYPSDILIHQWAKETGVQFCATAPSIIQHTGMVSTGLGGGGRASPSFVKELT